MAITGRYKNCAPPLNNDPVGTTIPIQSTICTQWLLLLPTVMVILKEGLVAAAVVGGYSESTVVIPPSA